MRMRHLENAQRCELYHDETIVLSSNLCYVVALSALGAHVDVVRSLVSAGSCLVHDENYVGCII